MDQNGIEISKTRVYSSNGVPKCSEKGKAFKHNSCMRAVQEKEVMLYPKS